MTQGPASSYPLVSTQTNIEYARGFYDDKVGGIMPSIMPNAPHRQAADSFRNEHDRRGGKAPEGSHFDRLDRSYHENNQAYKDLNAALKAADKRVKDQEALRRLSEQYTQTASAAQKEVDTRKEMQQSYVGYDHQTSARGHSTRIKIVQKGAEKKRKTGENCERRSRNA